MLPSAYGDDVKIRTRTHELSEFYTQINFLLLSTARVSDQRVTTHNDIKSSNDRYFRYASRLKLYRKNR
jgi:hypothetical protein